MTSAEYAANMFNTASVYSNKLAFLTMYLHEQYKMYADKDIKFNLKPFGTKFDNSTKAIKKVQLKPRSRNTVSRCRKLITSDESKYQRKVQCKKIEISDPDDISDNDDELESD